MPDYGDRRIIRVAGRPERNVGIKNILAGWQDVRQLAFAFQDGDWRTVQAFYATQGPLGDPLFPQMPGLRERVGWAAAALDWFRALTALVDALQNGRIGQLWDHFGEPRELSPLERGNPVYFAGPHLRGDDPGLGYCIRWVPTIGDDGRCFSPKDAAEVVAATWEAVSQAVELELSRVPLALISRTVSDPLHPRLYWGFQADGALHEAFLDWFFRVFAPLKIATCRAQGCDHPVLAPRRAYCSTACKNRQKQRDYRQRKACLSESRRRAGAH